MTAALRPAIRVSVPTFPVASRTDLVISSSDLVEARPQRRAGQLTSRGEGLSGTRCFTLRLGLSRWGPLKGTDDG